MIGMVIEVGVRVAKDVTSSDYSAHGDLAMEMQMAIITPRRRLRQGWADMLVVEAQPQCWEDLASWIRQLDGPYGIRREERLIRDRLLCLEHKIVNELDRLSHHPAYRGNAVVGVDSTVLPAFRVEGHAQIGPTPLRARRASGWADGALEHGVLEPELLKVRGRLLTRWDFSADRERSPA